ncbi:MAG: PQQ-dependent sugar dehydrogenase [Candidatus Tectomicrobia bacterium]|uniref:PQQ-dependent sugar dehydrogenase n=1 Tax=Tectimicrobiota bacterium TaxID=2528274 RepID=A0A937VYU4_UNCTE|nr:PQQ-dependent sugar dehydrogenase [Candidatus Tectomicrobia bacterium]
MAPAAWGQAFSSEHGRLRVVTVASGLEHPWGLAFLPDGRMLVTERPGRLRLVTPDGILSAPLENVPPVFARGQGGLLDVALDPRFSENRLLYLSYAEPGSGGAGTAVARGQLAHTQLDDVRVIFRQEPKVAGGLHFGSRLVFAADGRLFVTLGERNQPERAQRGHEHLGKLVRITTDGTVPPTNPFVGKAGVKPEIWSLGHRNVQGAALHPSTQVLWTAEHGAQGGDELNTPEAGKNYGWPIITYGRDYSGASIGEGTAKAGLEQPRYYWDPSIAPSGMTFYTATRLSAWQGNLFIGSLKFRLLVRLQLEGTRVVREERLLQDLAERIRDVRQGPDGLLYLLTDHPKGRILRVEPFA